MTDAELVARLRVNIVTYKQLQAHHGSLRSLSLPGLWAFVQPGVPETLSHQVLFDDDGGLERALPALEDFYRDHGARLWRVLVPPESAAGQFLGGAGYQPDGGIPAMGLSLEDTPLTPPAIAVEQLPAMEELIPLNGEAWGPGSSFRLLPWHSRSFAHVHVRGVHEGGRLVAGGLAHDLEETAGIYLVATLDAVRGRGLATEVVRSLLVDARARGRTAAVLQATDLGYGAYRRVGFRDLGTWAYWLRRLG